MLIFTGCTSHPPAARPVPVAQPDFFSDPQSGVRIAVPSGWKRNPSDDYTLQIVPEQGSVDSGIVFISLHIPKLPAHIPGLIPMLSVRSGYLGDLREQFQGLSTQDLAAPSLPNTNARMLRSEWPASGGAMSETALLLVHDDHVFILRGRSDAQHESQVRAGFDQFVGSLEWEK